MKISEEYKHQLEIMHTAEKKGSPMYVVKYIIIVEI
jgi:hypothetical protein